MGFDRSYFLFFFDNALQHFQQKESLLNFKFLMTHIYYSTHLSGLLLELRPSKMSPQWPSTAKARKVTLEPKGSDLL